LDSRKSLIKGRNLDNGATLATSCNQNRFWKQEIELFKQEIELFKQEMELFLPLPDF
jgi:hypothetical protein